MSDHKHYHHLVIDGRGHLLGRLASIVAKQLLNGQRLVRDITHPPRISMNSFGAEGTIKWLTPSTCTGCGPLRGDQRLRLVLPQQAYALPIIMAHFATQGSN